jgi:uncharacterized protein
MDQEAPTMVFDANDKRKIKQDMAKCLAIDTEITRIVVFGSFNQSENPADIDVAVFQTSNQPYMPLALKYRSQTRSVSLKISLDIIPIRPNAADGPLLDEINKGEVIFER